MSRHENWCDGHLDAPLIDRKHASRGTCKRCGYVGPLRERSGHLYPHKRFDRYAPEPTGEDYFEAARRGFCPNCPRAIVPGDFVTYNERGLEIHYECPDAELNAQRQTEIDTLSRASTLLRADSLNANDFMLTIAAFLDDVREDAQHDDAPAYLTRALQIARSYLGGVA